MSKVCYTVIDGVTREIAKKYVVVDGVTRLCYQNVIDLSTATVTLGANLTYNGSSQTKAVTVVLDGVTLVAGTDYTVTGNTGTDAGNYTMTITGIGDYEGTIQKSWSIAKLSLTQPTVSGAYTYDGSEQSCTVNDMNEAYITQSGTASATDAGTYSVTFTLKDTDNTQWSDGTTAAVTRTWSIAKATGSISVSPTTLSITGAAGTTKTATISYTGDGSISVSSSATGVATATRSGNTITVKLVATGSATITISIAETENCTSASCTLKVTAINASTTLGDNSWAKIAEMSAAGLASSIWKVGDTKTETLNGTSYTFRIVGFDHDDLNSSDAKYSDSSYNGGKKKAGITFEMVEIFNTRYSMNISDTNSGGWDSSYMRKTVMQTMKGYMSTALKNVLRTVSKLASAGSSSSTIKTSADELFLLSEVEIRGTVNYSYAGEGTQYAYYKAGNSAIKKRGGSASDWWLRSPRSSNDYHFVYVYSGGSLSYYAAYGNSGVAFGFCI